MFVLASPIELTSCILLMFSIRCGASQSGNLRNSEDALDGIIGFGKSNASVISQLASYGKVKKMFAHCLDGENGGGIFAIGHVVQPKVNSTRLIQDQSVMIFLFSNYCIFALLMIIHGVLLNDIDFFSRNGCFWILMCQSMVIYACVIILDHKH